MSPGFLCALCLAILGLHTLSFPQTVTDIYDFSYQAGFGNEPLAAMISGPNGVFYGTTQSGGDLNCPGGAGGGCGTIFQLAPSGGQWSYSTIYQFRGLKDGLDVYVALALDAAGNLYAPTTSNTPSGAIYKLAPGAPGKPWKFSLIYQFKNQTDGAWALSPLLIDQTGTIYGATQLGGSNGAGCNQQFGCGAIFQLVPPARKGEPWMEHTLYKFQGSSDGGNPSTLLLGSNGVLYGTTTNGGIFNSNCALGCGVIFQLTPQNGAWTYSVIHSFDGSPDALPYGNLVQGANGTLYGLDSSSGSGAIFQLAPRNGNSWAFSDIHKFSSGYPATNLTMGSNGTLYGDIYGDQDFDAGYLFQLVQQRSKWKYTTLVDFNTNGVGSNPSGVLVYGGDLFVSMTDGGYAPGNINLVAP